MTTINNGSSSTSSLNLRAPNSGVSAINKDGTFTPEWRAYFNQAVSPKVNLIADNYIHTVTSTTTEVINVNTTTPNTASITLNATLTSIGSLNNSLGLLYNNGSGSFSYAPLPTGSVESVNIVSANGFSGSVSSPTTTPAITLSTSVNGLIKGSGGSLVAAVSGVDYYLPGGALGTPASGVLSNLTGAILTPAQPNITSVGTLTSLSVSGAVSMGNTVTTSTSNTVTNKVHIVIGGITYYLLASTSAT
jgi:hypothetical protein